ncbi:MAG: peptide-methionine (S)-S-oxide reductase MsrA [Pseudomonadota bacterium]|nr:peptide-methionine (S)-S-oxide reductase MsrA [Pseudomonadota bacterium]
MKKRTFEMIFGLVLASSCFFEVQSIFAEEAYQSALFAGGCFWCMQESFDKVEGVVRTTVGYSGGQIVNPTYEVVSKGKTNHLEAVLVVFNPTIIDFVTLLKEFWRNVDPTDSEGQFCDRGRQYRSAIFFSDPTEEAEARKSVKQMVVDYFPDKGVSTLLLPYVNFYAAEDYHQNYYKKNPYKYKYYKYRCGRVKRLEELDLLH